jgi:hypothetical protein
VAAPVFAAGQLVVVFAAEQLVVAFAAEPSAAVVVAGVEVSVVVRAVDGGDGNEFEIPALNALVSEPPVRTAALNGIGKTRRGSRPPTR